MIRIFICAILILFYGHSREAFKHNQLNVNDLMERFFSIEKIIYPLVGKDSIILYKDRGEIVGASRMNEQKEFHIAFDKPLTLHEIPKISHYDYYTTKTLTNAQKSTFIKTVGGIYSVQYVFDQNSRIIKYFSEDHDIIFINRKGYTKLNFQGPNNYSKLLLRTEGILGTLDSFIVKDPEGRIILVVIDDKPYIPVIDLEGSLRKIVDFSGKEVASITYSIGGNVVSYTGLLKAPHCFRGMYREKISGIYFDENRYYDADLETFLDTLNPNLVEYDQEVEF